MRTPQFVWPHSLGKRLKGYVKFTNDDPDPIVHVQSGIIDSVTRDGVGEATIALNRALEAAEKAMTKVQVEDPDTPFLVQFGWSDPTTLTVAVFDADPLTLNPPEQSVPTDSGMVNIWIWEPLDSEYTPVV